ncbi:hypothetical protein ABFS83_02G100100 [Erythranthe nasuta]
MQHFNLKIIVVYSVLFASTAAAVGFVGDHISINCGSSTTSSTPTTGREWLPDVPTIIKGSSTTTTTRSRLISTTTTTVVPYNTARISLSQFSYTFNLNPGQKLIRLHFNPTTSYNGFDDLFTVEAGPYTLLSNFSASITARALSLTTFAKEFCIIITHQNHHPFNIIFSPSPSSSSSKNTYAFINGIEIVSVPSTLSYCHSGDAGVQLVATNSVIHIDNSTALEIVHRLNIRGTFGMSANKLLIINNDNNNNITWKIPVDVGFRYLIRLHFYEQGLQMAQAQHKDFTLFINDVIATTSEDIHRQREHQGILCYNNYMVMVNGNKHEGKRDIFVSLYSKHEFVDGHSPLEGFDIFKLSNNDNSLASPNPLPPPTRDSSSSRAIRFLLSVLGRRNAVATAVIAVICLLNVIVHMLPQNLGDNFTLEEEEKPPARTNRLCRCFSLAEIQSATDGFNEALVIGKGGFGKVYKGFVDNMQEIVAIKRLKPDSKQGKREFWTEIEMLSELRHVNLVSLIGYCNEQNEMILVYEHMPCGTLADHLYKLARKGNVWLPLSWKHRLQICIGAARGLDYLHTGNGIIHRDVKASNILLDQNFVAKVSDFGLAKIEIGSQASTDIVKGTFGYFDPDYLRNRKLTTKCDTYSFGVVLLEVLCGRPAVEPWAEEDKQSLTMWARDYISKGEVEQIIAPSLRQRISPDSLKTFVLVAARCLRDDPKKRPAIANVVLKLEVALKQQENAESLEPNEITSVADGFLSAVKVQHQENRIPMVPNEIEANVANVLPQQENVIAPVTNVRTNVVDAMQEREKSVSPNEIAIVANTASHSNRNILSVSSRQLMTASSSVQNVAFPLKEKNKSEMVSSGKKAMHKLSYLLPPWNAVWSSALKPSKRKDPASLLISAKDEITTVKSLQYGYSTIKAATNDFSDNNKLGEGGFGAVYKGKLPNNQEITVKRLFMNSIMGDVEFKNEILLLPKLQHRNLVRLLGFSIHGTEKLLVYEFVQNGGLHLYMSSSSDPTKRSCLDWEKHYKIIRGVARGLVYLHEDSQLRIIHLDIKPSNILLDSEMNPKIADFGTARLFEQDETHGSTSWVIGTYGYMSPEYAMYGHFSIKSDVFSFGVLVLEIMSGKKKMFTLPRDDEEHLLTLTWNNWREGTIENMIDPILRAAGTGSLRDMIKCIHIGLLCVQQNAAKRPTMASILLMLNSSTMTMPVPSEPAFLNASFFSPDTSLPHNYDDLNSSDAGK